MKLYDLPARQTPRPKIYELHPNHDPDGIVEFDHIDGMYSYCVAYAGDGTELGVVHLAAYVELEPYRDGFRLAPEYRGQPKD